MKILVKESLLLPVLFLLGVCIAVAGPLRLNQEEDSVVIPSGLTDYALVQVGSSLYVCWTESTYEQGSIVLARVDLERMEAREVFREGFTEEKVMSPALAVHGDQIELVWLLRKGRGRKSFHNVEFLSVDSSSKEARQRQSLEYGFQRRNIELHSTSRGLFLVGSSTPGSRQAMRLRLFKRDSGKWLSAEGPVSVGSYDQQPSLRGGEEYLHLAWIRDGKVHVARSSDGEEWSEAQALSTGGAREPLLLSGENQELALVWLENIGVKSCLVRLATSPDEGESWWHAPHEIRLEGTRCHLEMGFSRGTEHFLIYHYRNHDDPCEKLEFCIMSSDWRRERLDLFPEEVCGRSLSPSVLLGDNLLYVTWRMRRGKETSLVMNYSEFPGVKWLSSPVEFLKSEGKAVYVGPKLVSLGEQMFAVYFVYRASSGPFQKSLQRGNLILRRLKTRFAHHEEVNTG